MIVVPITKRIEIIMSINFVSFHGWTLIRRKIVEKKSFLANQKHQCHVSEWGAHDCSAHNKRNGDYCSIQACPIPWMNFDSKENGGNNSFSHNSKASISRILMRRTWLQSYNKKNGDYYEYLCLSYFTDKLWS